MLDRRRVVVGGVGALAAGLVGRAGPAAAADADSFQALYAAALADRSLADERRADTSDKLDDFNSKAVAPRVKPSFLPISDDALKLIVLFEVTSEALYTQRYQKPVWPGGESGVTIGIGYDLGYVTPEWFQEDWKGHLSPALIARLTPCCLKRGAAAKALTPRLKDVRVPWQVAYPQFKGVLIPRYTGLTVSKLPSAAKSLHPDCLGALVSLVYNRGAPFRSEKPRFRQMKRIRQHLEQDELCQVPGEYLDMRALWAGKPKMKGLVTRRELEAALFRQGLGKGAASCSVA